MIPLALFNYTHQIIINIFFFPHLIKCTYNNDDGDDSSSCQFVITNPNNK